MNRREPAPYRALPAMTVFRVSAARARAFIPIVPLAVIAFPSGGSLPCRGGFEIPPLRSGEMIFPDSTTQTGTPPR